MNLISKLPNRAALAAFCTLFFLSSCGDFKRARSKRIVEKAFEHLENDELEKALETAELAAELGSKDWKLYDLKGRLFFQLGQPEASLESYKQALEFLKASDESDPEFVSMLLFSKGNTSGVMGQYAESAADYEKSLEADEENSQSLNNLAWLLAVSPIDSIRDGERAVELAEKACELTAWNNAASIDTLAAAHAEIGEFEEAVKYQKRVLEMLRAQGNLTEDQLNEMGFSERLKLFEEGKPYRKDFIEEYQAEHPRKTDNDS